MSTTTPGLSSTAFWSLRNKIIGRAWALPILVLDKSGNRAIIGEKGCDRMAVRLNDDQEMVQMIREGLKRTGGYCPCRLERTEENKCICKEFREQMADPDFKGFCHCMLYYKD